MTTTSSAPIYWVRHAYEDWTMHLAADDEGLIYADAGYADTRDESFAEMAAWADARMPDRPLVRDERRLERYTVELSEYLSGIRQRFTFPIHFHGTPFQMAVWNALLRIPFGQTRSYSDIARQLHKPRAVRAVGRAIGANPILIAVPCHRVIGKNGSLTGFSSGLHMKVRLLQLERSGAQKEGKVSSHG